MRKLAFIQASPIAAPKIVTAARIRTLDPEGTTPEAFLGVGVDARIERARLEWSDERYSTTYRHVGVDRLLVVAAVDQGSGFR